MTSKAAPVQQQTAWQKHAIAFADKALAAAGLPTYTELHKEVERFEMQSYFSKGQAS